MRGTHVARLKGLDRVLAVLSASALFLSLMVVFAPAALAHHPEISASQVCEEGEVRIAYESVSWLTTGASGSAHNDIRIEIQVNGSGTWVEVGNGAYNAGNDYRFSGSFDAEPYVGDSLVVRARAVGPWTNGQGGGETRSTSAIVVNLECSENATAVDPEVSLSEVCGVADFLVVPGTVGVTYLLDGQAVNGETITGPVSGTLTAVAEQGYRLTNPEWSFEFQLEAGDPCPGEVTPVAPGVVQSTECGRQGSVSFPVTPGLRYLLDGLDVSGQTLPGPISGTVMVEVLPGYVLAEGAVTEISFLVAPAEVCDEVLDEEIEPDEVADLEVLPFTGSDTGLLVALGTALLGIGWTLVRGARRREQD
ncbi:MAG TPA: hypothetical protein VIC07_03450 [Acidimicrobiia bacterium]|jgi:hypothetical protein